MLFAARSALALLTSRERLVFWALVAARAIVGFLDVFGILLVGVVAALGATQFDGAGGATVVFGVELPALDGQGLLLLVLFVLGVFVIKALIAIGLSRALTAFVARIESRNAAALSTHLLTGDLAHVRRFSRNELQFALTESIKWTFTGLLNNIAGIVNEGGNVLGMMPHPERNSETALGDASGAAVFRSIIHSFEASA